MPAVDVAGAELFYEEQGAGVPVLMIHGTGCNIHNWGATPERVAERHRAIAYDRRGYDGSRCEPARDYGEHADDALTLLDRLDARPAIVVGWSSGSDAGRTEHPRRPCRGDPAGHPLTALGSTGRGGAARG